MTGPRVFGVFFHLFLFRFQGVKTGVPFVYRHTVEYSSFMYKNHGIGIVIMNREDRSGREGKASEMGTEASHVIDVYLVTMNVSGYFRFFPFVTHSVHFLILEATSGYHHLIAHHSML